MVITTADKEQIQCSVTKTTHAPEGWHCFISPKQRLLLSQNLHISENRPLGSLIQWILASLPSSHLFRLNFQLFVLALHFSVRVKNTLVPKRFSLGRCLYTTIKWLLNLICDRLNWFSSFENLTQRTHSHVAIWKWQNLHCTLDTSSGSMAMVLSFSPTPTLVERHGSQLYWQGVFYLFETRAVFMITLF